MSAVDDVEARIYRLQTALQGKLTELQTMLIHQQYNASVGVDQDSQGRSVASLQVKVLGARRVLFRSGFLCGNTTYVRAYLEPQEAATGTPSGVCTTSKQPVSYDPCWQEALVFNGVSMIQACLNVDVMQTEHIVADQLIGKIRIPLIELQDQRASEKWHVLLNESHSSIGEVLLVCQFHRSRISALQVETALLQNQLKELVNFHNRQQKAFTPDSMISSKRLEGKEVSGQVITLQRNGSSRFNAADSLRTIRKREYPEFKRTPSVNTGDAVFGTELPRSFKRQKVVPEPEPNVPSLTDRLSNWLLPSANGPSSSSSSTSSVAASAAASQWAAVAATPASASVSFAFVRDPNEKVSRHHKRGKPSAARMSMPAKMPSMREAIQSWLFQDKDAASPPVANSSVS